MNKRYLELLLKFYRDKELIELFDLAILDDNRVREYKYNINGEYPERRDLLGKLRNDLNTVIAVYNDTK